MPSTFHRASIREKCADARCYYCLSTFSKTSARVSSAVPKSTRYKNKWAAVILKDWQRVRSVKFPVVEVGGVLKSMNRTKFSRLLGP